ncbi:class I SAM-dependent methyltransferase [Catenuloplanes atrovinosus]|uniref:SAM-dependent methyltransferase n=1 Tax=Catenuloplanes atrovinosus TaxID=137266 RepID=A0AAE3YHA6_9ACTN|nr:class I SAM-dependent methyltransferase [Catenuloplanes atrovinosus]MDR7273908.1 SAM-dependent methyltransferase [Catenuloplanes atrovinosus]
MSGHGHGHGHGHTDIDWARMGDQLERGAGLYAPALREAFAWLRGLTGPVADVLDLGAGPGAISALLAVAFPEAEVVAVDGSAPLLDRARARAERDGLRITTRHADLPDGLDTLPAGEAGLVWVSGALHHLGDQQDALRRIARLLRPGGLLALQEGGLAPRYLPRDFGLGRPGLQERLDAAQEEWFAAMRASLPGHTRAHEHWPAMMAAAGLEPAGTRSFLTDLPAPLPDHAREHVLGDLTRRRETLAEHLSGEDVATLDRLIDAHAPDGVPLRPDVFMLTARTVHAARALS